MNNIICRSYTVVAEGVLRTTTSRPCPAKLRPCLNVNFSLIYSDYRELFWEAWAMDTRPLLDRNKCKCRCRHRSRRYDLPAHRPLRQQLVYRQAIAYLAQHEAW